MSLRLKLESAGWKQGSIIKPKENKEFESIVEDHLSSLTSGEEKPSTTSSNLQFDGVIAIILTYDCAVVSDSLEKEPWLQLLIAWPIAKIDANFEYGKNPRKLHFEVNHADEVVFYECSAISLLQIPRQWIEDRLSICDLKCTQDTVNILARWYSQRILAPTFPTEFIDSLRSKDKRIKKLWKKSAVMNLSAVFIKINQKDKIFYLDIILSHRFEGKQHRQFHQESEDVLLNDFKSIFTVANKVEVKNVSLENEYQLSMIVLTTHQRFSPYHPSLDDIPADMSPSLLG